MTLDKRRILSAMCTSVWNGDHVVRGTLKRVARGARAELAAVFPQWVHHRLRHSYILSKICWWVDMGIAGEEEFLVRDQGGSPSGELTHRHRICGPPRRLQINTKKTVEVETRPVFQEGKIGLDSG